MIIFKHKNKSVFKPQKNKCKILDQNIDPISKLNWATINDLKNDKNIEEPDKEGYVVIPSKSHHKSMIA